MATHYPYTASGVWVGTAADTFFTDLATAQTTVGALSTDLDGYARDCGAKAWRLEGEAGDLGAHKSPADHP